jgi:hypothetical protein
VEVTLDSDIGSYILVAALAGLLIYGLVSKLLKDRQFKQSLQKGLSIPTKSGVTVQSHGEEVLANYFHDHRITFVYDLPARFSIFQAVSIRPDFYLPDYDVYIEYWGMKGNAAYDKKTEWKRKVYRKYGKRLIDIYVSDIKSKGFVNKIKGFGITN